MSQFLKIQAATAKGPALRNSRGASLLAWLGKQRTREALIGYLFILPALIGFIIFYALPAVRGLLISFTNWNLLTPAEYVGFQNYQRLFNDPGFWNSVQVTVRYVAFNIPLQIIIAMALALFMDRVSQRSAWLRNIIIIPWLLPGVVVALLWMWMLDNRLGIVNAFLNSIGIPSQPFLGSVDQVIPSIALINIWRYAGYTSILLFAGLKTIPQQLYDAASIDGADGVRQFWNITLPLLRPVLAFVLITHIIGSFQIFDTIAVTSGGGPVRASQVLYWYIYEFAFVRFNMGYATAIATVLFVALVGVTLIQMRFFRANNADLADFS
ncbi:sugar ABC transporter permease [Oscillatoria laete-virens NRMC-F 0139]|nr:sugar ABC transporter permease [Oscillatoria laete-virens NRMC-F 0139]